MLDCILFVLYMLFRQPSLTYKPLGPPDSDHLVFETNFACNFLSSAMTQSTSSYSPSCTSMADVYNRLPIKYKYMVFRYPQT